MKPTLTLCIPTKENINAYTVASLLSAGNFPDLLTIYQVRQDLIIGQSDIPKARSRALTEWYGEVKNEEDIFIFIDSDQTFTVNDILKAVDIYKEHGGVVCGAYSRSTGTATVEPKHPKDFANERCGEIYYGGTGFMLIGYPTVQKMAEHLGKTQAYIKDLEVIPFFFPRIVRKTESAERDSWLGEDYSFCWLTRHVGGKVWGFLSPTIGHVISKRCYLDLNSVKF